MQTDVEADGNPALDLIRKSRKAYRCRESRNTYKRYCVELMSGLRS